jgi:hypothetical protein
MIANTVMDWNLWKRIVDSLTWKPMVCAFSHGEPFLDPLFHERLEYLAQREHMVDFATNGTVERPDVLEVISRNTKYLHQVIVSLDGLYSTTREGYRGVTPAQVMTPLETISSLLRIKEKDPSFKVGVSMVQNGQDWDERERFIVHWLKQGCDLVLVRRHLSSVPLEKPYPKSTCHYLDGWIMTISANGKVRLCDRYMNTRWVGDCREKTPLEIFNDEPYASYRRFFPVETCVTCPQPYSGRGFYGKVHLKDDSFSCYFSQDYYNDMFSKELVKKGLSWGGGGELQ